ncbi:MAG: sulfur carrier protein ThiS [Candidatus Omnitrophota bacterium]|jgi:sulfur carrier protein
MSIKLNGKKISFNSGITLYDLLVEEGFIPDRIIVEHNLSIVPKEEWRKIIIAQNDNLEVLSFVGGG